MDLGINPNVLVPVGMYTPTLFARQPSSFANEVFHVVAVSSIMRSLYSSDDLVVGSRTELIAWVNFWIAMMFAAVEYLDDARGCSLDGRTRFTKPACRRMCRVGYRLCVWM